MFRFRVVRVLKEQDVYDISADRTQILAVAFYVMLSIKEGTSNSFWPKELCWLKRAQRSLSEANYNEDWLSDFCCFNAKNL